MLEGKTCLITGGTSGVGKATALALARLHARVVIVARNKQRALETLNQIKVQVSDADCDFLIGDLSSEASIRYVADEFCGQHQILNLLVNNAGVALKKRTFTCDGIEMTFAVNHLAYFLLTHLLMARLKQNVPSHIINVSSEAHRNAILDFDNLQGEKKYTGFAAYSLTKLCNVLFTYELSRRLKNTRVTANAVHPGYLHTRIFRDTPALFRLFVRLTAGRPVKGARAILHVAELAGRDHITGRYFNGKKDVSSSAVSYDIQLAERLWAISERFFRSVPRL